MGLSWLFFSFEGRINRAIWWGVAVGLAAIDAAVLFWTFEWAVQTLPLVVTLVTLALQVAPTVKRLHDRSKSGWWVVVFYGLPFIFELVGGTLFDPVPRVYGLAVASALITLWALVELGFLRGTSGNNQFGADPRAGRQVGRRGPI